MPNNLLQTHLKRLQKEIPKRRYVFLEERQEVINELRLKYYNNGRSENHKNYNKLVQTQLQNKMIKNFLKKDTYLQKKGKKLLLI